MAYAQSVVTEDWNSMIQSGAGSIAARHAFTTVSKHTLAVHPDNVRHSMIYSEMLRSLDWIAESRAFRLNTVNLGLPELYWEVMLFAVAMVVFVSVWIEQTFFRAMILAAQAAVLGALVGFVFLMDHPFKGTTQVTAQPIVEAMDRMKTRTE
jgi:hypothetical protein